MTQTIETAVKMNDVLSVKKEVLRLTRMDEGQWCAMMFDKGCEFAENFCKQFSNPKYNYNQLVKVEATKNGRVTNFFWSWWRFKWTLNDKEWLINEPYQCAMTNTYDQWKEAMLNNYQLDRELLEDLDTKSF
jgi:hypothetical protein